MSLETRSTSALFKRAEQLKRWQESDTFLEPCEPKHKSRRIQFTDGCVFLAACAATDRDEVDRLIRRGADIDTTNVDGLTALHQACIDDNLEMVEFLVQRGADVNRGDNEGWTPLHATASCGFLSIAKFLLDHGASVSAVNNDGELAIDISESDEMEELLQKEIDRQGVNCDKSRHTEERMMLEDAKGWLNAKRFGDKAHEKTGATALHVAAAKGYIKVMGVLVQAGAPVNSQDLDGWTPLHAAAHWAQREACEILCKEFCNMDIKNHVGQTAFDVADPDVLELLEQLQKKQTTMQKDRPDITSLLNRPAVPSITSTTSNVSTNSTKRRSSITRLSESDKSQRYKEERGQEREVLTKASLPETIPERVSENSHTTSSSVYGRHHASQHSSNEESKLIPNYTPPQIGSQDDKAGGSSGGSSSSATVGGKSGFPFGGSSISSTASGSSSSLTTPGDSQDVHPWRRPASLRIRPTSGVSGGGQDGTGVNRLSPSVDVDTLRRNHSFEDRPRPRADFETNSLKKDQQKQQNEQQPVRRSFVPPVRDEESETQRKAHAKRVRGTRRSTQGVTLEDLKSAEQLVKKKQQLENQQRTSELQQLVASQQQGKTSTTDAGSKTVTHQSPVTNATITTRRDGLSVVSTVAGLNSNSAAAAAAEESTKSILSSSSTNNPSWKVRVDATKSKFQSEDNKLSTSVGSSGRSYGSGSSLHQHSPSPAASSASGSGSGGLGSSSHLRDKSSAESSSTSATVAVSSAAGATLTPDRHGSSHPVKKKNKPKRRSTGVVNFEEVGQEAEEDEDSYSSDHSKRDYEDRSQNGVVDYKKLWEESQISNSCLREDLAKVRDELTATRKKLESSMQVVVNNGLSETEKKEKRALEKKLSEMEEELKQLEHLKNDNQRLRDENGALIRVISKLSK